MSPKKSDLICLLWVFYTCTLPTILRELVTCKSIALIARKDPYKRQKTSVSINKLFFILTSDQVRIKVHDQLFVLLGVNYLHKPNKHVDILYIFDMAKRETYLVKY